MTAVRAFQITCAALAVAALSSAAQAGTLKVLYSFQGPNGGDGADPYAAPFMDSKGDLYGTTTDGGVQGFGVVYRLHRAKNGTWNETVLHSFTGGADGGVSAGGVVVDRAGNVYGGTEYGGDPACGNGLGCGVVYELSPAKGGAWTETVLYTLSFAKTGFPIRRPVSQPCSGWQRDTLRHDCLQRCVRRLQLWQRLPAEACERHLEGTQHSQVLQR